MKEQLRCRTRPPRTLTSSLSTTRSTSSNSKRVLTRDQILEAVWDYTFADDDSVLETYISYLRHKIDDVDPPLIHTVRGVGYRLRPPR